MANPHLDRMPARDAPQDRVGASVHRLVR